MNQIDHTASQSSDSQQPNRLNIVRSLRELRVQYADEHEALQGQIDALLRKMDAVDLLIASETGGSKPDVTADGIPSDEVVESPRRTSPSQKPRLKKSSRFPEPRPSRTSNIAGRNVKPAMRLLKSMAGILT